MVFTVHGIVQPSRGTYPYTVKTRRQLLRIIHTTTVLCIGWILSQVNCTGPSVLPMLECQTRTLECMGSNPVQDSAAFLHWATSADNNVMYT